ncbi:HNH endonuclease [Streptomyces sp. SYSU K21746]
MRLRVGASRRLVYQDVTYYEDEEFDVPDENAAQWLRSGYVLPADGEWPEGVYKSVRPQAQAPEPDSGAAPSNAHPECDPRDKPKNARSSMQVCPVVGCHCQTWKGKCRAHARSRSDGKRYGDSHNDSPSLRARWDRTKREYLRANPYCECQECAAVPEPLRLAATEVDHIDGLGLQGPRAFDWSNLQSLTKAHHSRKTAGESFGH